MPLCLIRFLVDSAIWLCKQLPPSDSEAGDPRTKFWAKISKKLPNYNHWTPQASGCTISKNGSLSAPLVWIFLLPHSATEPPKVYHKKQIKGPELEKEETCWENEVFNTWSLVHLVTIDWPTFLAQVKLTVSFGPTEVKPCIWVANQLCKALIVCYKKKITWNPVAIDLSSKAWNVIASSAQVGHWDSSVALLVHQAAHETPKRSVTWVPYTTSSLWCFKSWGQGRLISHIGFSNVIY